MQFSQSTAKDRGSLLESKWSDQRQTDNHQREHCRCDSTVLKLRILNLTSENHNLKKKLNDKEQNLKNSQSYELAFRKAIQMIRQLTQDHSLSSERFNIFTPKHLELPQGTKQSLSTMKDTKQSCINSLLESSHPQAINPFTLTKSPLKGQGQTYKLQEYEHLRKLAQDVGRKTVKSLDISHESHSSLMSNQQEHKNNQDMYAMREEYQQSRQQMQAIFNAKIDLFKEEIVGLKAKNVELCQKLRKNGQEQLFSLTPQAEQRGTAFFHQIDTISEKQFEESLEGSQIDKRSVELGLNDFEKEGKSVSSEVWAQTAEQMRSVKQTLLKLQQIIKNGSTQIISILETLYKLKKMSKNVKIIELEQYRSLLQANKNYCVSTKRCQSLQNEISKLKTMIKQFL